MLIRMKSSNNILFLDCWAFLTLLINTSVKQQWWMLIDVDRWPGFVWVSVSNQQEIIIIHLYYYDFTCYFLYMKFYLWSIPGLFDLTHIKRWLIGRLNILVLFLHSSRWKHPSRCGILMFWIRWLKEVYIAIFLLLTSCTDYSYVFISFRHERRLAYWHPDFAAS